MTEDVIANTEANVEEVIPEDSPEVETQTENNALPELSDEQLLSILEKRQEFKVPIKVDGVDEGIDFNDLKKGFSHQSAASRRMNEAVNLQNQYQTKITEFGNLLKEKPEQLLQAYGIDVNALAQQQQAEQQRVEALSPEEKKISNLESQLNEMKGMFDNLKGELNNNEAKSYETQIRSEFDKTAERYPVMKDPELQKFAAFQMYNNPGLTTDEAFNQVNTFISERVTKGKDSYIESKKVDATKGVLGSGNEVASKAKDIRKMGMQERLKAILENINSY